MKSFIAWVGGKSQLAADIVQTFPEHKTYVEVFGGAAWVLFRKEPSKVEVYNDVNSWLVNLFLVVRDKPEEFLERQLTLLPSREIYIRFKKEFEQDSFKDDVEKAVAFYYLIRNSFCSTVTGGWNFSKSRPPAPRPGRAFLMSVSERLKRVYIENRSFEKLIPQCDSSDTLFYYDPPYVVCKSGRYYQHQFTYEEQHTMLRDLLAGIKGKFVLSYDDDPIIRKLYKGYTVRFTKKVNYSLARNAGGHRRKTELLITNF